MILGFGVNKMGNIKEAMMDSLTMGETHICSRCKDQVYRIKRVNGKIYCEDCYFDLVSDYCYDDIDDEVDEEGDRI